MKLLSQKKPKGYGTDLNLSIPKAWQLVKYGRNRIERIDGPMLNRRIDNMETMKMEVRAWQTHRNNKEAKIKWQFTAEDARIKLLRLYPSIHD